MGFRYSKAVFILVTLTYSEGGYICLVKWNELLFCPRCFAVIIGSLARLDCTKPAQFKTCKFQGNDSKKDGLAGRSVGVEILSKSTLQPVVRNLLLQKALG